jgi:hypothetical protein
MTGQIALMIRYMLYPLSGALVARGILTAESEAQTVNTLAELLAGVVVYVGAVVWSRVAKAKGGAT